MSRYIMVSNRVSVDHPSATNSGGLAVAITSALQKTGGIWFGWSGNLSPYSSALNLEHREPITYATMDLTPEAFEDYYCGFSNSVLWPAFHYRMDLASYDHQQYETYRRTNEEWAQQLKKIIEPDDMIWVHDYHLIPFAHYCRDIGISNRIGFFLHIPFPSPEVYDAIPCGQELLEDLTYYDLIGFHTKSYEEAFLSCLNKVKPTQEPNGQSGFKHQSPVTGVYPLGVDVVGIRKIINRRHTETKKSLQHKKKPDLTTIISVDRVDYTKGLPERLSAIEHFLETFPNYRQKLQFIQIAPDSRQDIPAYQTLREEFHMLFGRINHHYGRLDWTPLLCLNEVMDRQTLMQTLNQTHIGLVTPLRDGMNLIAKEFVAAQDPKDPGILILSEFAGAAEELEGALLVNPYDPAALASVLDQALQMSLEERKERYAKMMNILLSNDVETWHERFWANLQAARSSAVLTQKAIKTDLGTRLHQTLRSPVGNPIRS